MSHTPLDLHNHTVPELRKIAKELTDDPTSKLRKAELIDLIVKASKVAEPAVIGTKLHEQMEEAVAVEAVDQVIHEELSDLAPTLRDLAGTMGTVTEAMRKAARQLAIVAWSRQRAVVRSMGHTVRGRVVDTVLREPGPDGTGRVCLVIEHTEQAVDKLGVRTWQPAGHTGHPRRTLHALADVNFEPLAS